MLPWELTERILRTRSLDELAASAAQCARLLGFEHHVYVMQRSRRIEDGEQRHYRLHNLQAEAFGALYGPSRIEPDDSLDARIEHARAGLPATPWSVSAGVAHTRPDLARRARGLLRTAQAVGLRGGITVPIWSPGGNWGLMTFSTGATSELGALAPRVAPALYLASCLDATARRLHGTPATTLALSQRERDILRWTAIGKGSWEISRILAISEHTVNYHLQRAAKKLGVRGRGAASARALALGLIAL